MWVVPIRSTHITMLASILLEMFSEVTMKMLIERRALCGLLCTICFLAAMDTALGQAPVRPTADPGTEHSKWPGMQPNGTMLLPTQWSLKPAGRHLALGDFPVAMAMHPKENLAAILHAGYGEHEVVVVELASMKVVTRVVLPQTFTGICFNADGTKLFASGAEKEVIHQYNFKDGFVSDHVELEIANITEKQVPAGIAMSADDTSLYVACPWGNSVFEITMSDRSKRSLALEQDDFPYMVLPDRLGKKLYVSLWGHASIAVVDLQSFQVESRWKTHANPTEMILTQDGQTLYVSCANSNSVHTIDTETGKTLETISSALYPSAPNGSTPNSISLSRDERVLLVANATNNNIAAIDVTDRGHSHSLGFIPVGWYPTSVRFSPHDEKIYVTNGKGLTPKANRQGPNPLHSPPRTTMEYIGGLFRGTLAQIDPPTPREMSQYTKTAFSCSPLREDRGATAVSQEPNNPIPATVGSPSPIKYCLYIIKENRTYDQVFGDIPQGNGDPTICLFPERVTPNQHALVNEFVLLDNFYVESEVSADGHEWTMAAYATDFVEKVWPLTYRGSRERKLSYPAEGAFPIAYPSSGYLWDRAKEAGVSYRSYGQFVSNSIAPGGLPTTKIEALQGHFDEGYRSYDLSYPDVKRAARFLEELKRFEGEGEMPRLQILRLGNDHTSGTVPGKPTPTAMVADNDLALGQLIDGLSHSKFWKETAVFVVEDDAQNGSDHVDAHRTVALVISPYTKRKFVDSSMYSTSSMLRTMELILGLKPMTQFDAAALPMFHSFTSTPDVTPFQHRPANVDLNEVNAAEAFGAKLSATFDFSHEDAADDLLLNEVIWKSIRGADSPMPPPVRAGFVFKLDEDE